MNKNDIISNILTDKNKDIDNTNEFYQNLPNNYMLQRYISMTSFNNLSIINDTTNKIYDAYNDKLMMYKFYMTMIEPKIYIYKYLKKVTTKKNEEREKYIKQMSDYYEVSEQEIKDWLDMKEKVK